MKRSLFLSAIALVMAGPAATAQPSSEGGRKLQTSLTGAAEVPPGDPDGSGTATVTVNPGQQRICYTLEVRNIEPATAAHIHIGAVGTAPANNIVVTLEPPTDGDSDGCVSVTRELALAILKTPADYYINVHNAPFGPGAVRGQLAK